MKTFKIDSVSAKIDSVLAYMHVIYNTIQITSKYNTANRRMHTISIEYIMPENEG